ARLAGGAAALGLRLALVAGGVAVLLAVATVLLTTYLSARPRRRELAALRSAGVRRSALRRALLRGYGHVLGLPFVVGTLAGLAGVFLTSAAVPARPQVLVLALAATLAGLGVAMLGVLRLTGNRGGVA